MRFNSDIRLTLVSGKTLESFALSEEEALNFRKILGLHSKAESFLVFCVLFCQLP